MIWVINPNHNEMKDIKYNLTPFPNEEVSTFQTELQALLDKHNAQLEAEPQFMKNTIKGPNGESLDIWSQVMKFVVYKKTPLDGAVISPIQENDLPTKS